jgi:hypothetical protein
VTSPATHTQAGRGAPLSKGALCAMDAPALIALFSTLEAPTVEEMHGEYRATLLDQGSRLTNWLGRTMVHLPGRWWGKAFAPRTPDEGHGYNRFERRGRTLRSLRMRTHLGQSHIDSGTSYHLDYSAFQGRAHPLHTMWDEVRRLGDGRYLGLGRVGYTERQRRWLMPFLLEGPPEPFVPPSRW